MSRAEAREKRIEVKQKKFEDSRAAVLAKVIPTQVPKTVVQPLAAPEPKVAPHLQRGNKAAEETPKAIFDGSRYESVVTWCTSNVDTEGTWSWKEPRAWSAEEWEKIIHPKFSEFEKMTWAHVDTLSSGGTHKMHHSQELWELHPDAQSRWLVLHLQEFDSLFRFRLSNKKRVWGFVVQAHFYMVWWERNHIIYKSKRK